MIYLKNFTQLLQSLVLTIGFYHNVQLTITLVYFSKLYLQKIHVARQYFKMST